MRSRGLNHMYKVTQMTQMTQIFFFSFNFYVPQISQIYTDLETYSVFGMTQILSDEKNLRHLRHLRA